MKNNWEEAYPHNLPRHTGHSFQAQSSISSRTCFLPTSGPITPSPELPAQSWSPWQSLEQTNVGQKSSSASNLLCVLEWTIQRL